MNRCVVSAYIFCSLRIYHATYYTLIYIYILILYSIYTHIMYSSYTLHMHLYTYMYTVGMSPSARRQLYILVPPFTPAYGK